MTTEPITTDSPENSAEMGIDVQRLVRDSFPADPHEEQTHAIQKPSCEFIKEAAKQGWQWVAASYHGARFMFLPNV